MQIRRTKIIATLGPTTDSSDDLRALLEAGADVLRTDLSHGTVLPSKLEKIASSLSDLTDRSEGKVN